MGHPTIAWRRLDLDGRDAATVRETADGWRISGVAEFRETNTSSCLAYSITCAHHWHTLACDITGFARDQAVALSVRRDSTSTWTIDGVESTAVAGCIDIDLAFSPVTNLLPIRRLAPRPGDSARVRAAWLRFPELTLDVLDQTYTRIGANRYLYESGGGAFRRELTTDSFGLVVDYPGLWTKTDDTA